MTRDEVIAFQKAHGLVPDGIIGPKTQAVLDRVNAPAPAAPLEDEETRWPRDVTLDKMGFYGNFNAPGWASIYLIHIQPPFKMYYEGQLLTHGVLVNKQCADAMLAAFNEIWEKCNHDQSKVDATGVSDYGGCFNIRRIAGSNNYSNHSWACAIDLSPGTNGFTTSSAHTIGQIVIDAFKRQGARWGGDYHGRKDPMHFEFVSPA